MSEPNASDFPGLAESLLTLSRPVKRFIMIGSDAIMLPVCLWVALILKFDRLWIDLNRYAGVFLASVVAVLLIFSYLGLYRAVIRFMGPKVMASVIMGVSLSVLALGVYDRLLGETRIPLTVLAIYWALALLYVAGSRFIVRYAVFYSRNDRNRRRVIIYGAGEAGAKLSSVLLGGPGFEPIAFVDDKHALHGSRINGLKVFSPDMLPELIRDHVVERVLMAMPSTSRRHRREILERLEPLGIHVQSLPDLSDIISGKSRIDELRELDVSDVLGRDPVPPDAKLFQASIRGKCVMVTGAGGSIGAELCRQIVRQGPRRLVLFEMSEIALYHIAREFQGSHELAAGVEIIPLLGNAHHRHRIREVLTSLGIQTVYHAAAYKHVPIVEHNVIEGIHNNVISTWHAAEAAIESGVETFVLISTDKAVNPANVMGATKRLAELVLQGLQSRSKTGTRFCMVRFGNVLASSGSVVPLFQEQIRRGGPVTVTHPEVMRYFMTIPEAAQLVIQAGAMARGGDVFVLNMGQPVRIADLARRMINLMGLTVREEHNPDGDIEIKYTGLRAAEKLFEELLIGSNVMGTDHPMIMRAIEHSIPWDRMQTLLNELLSALGIFDCKRAIALLGESVAEYRMVPEIHDYVWNHRGAPAAAADGKVTDFASKRRHSEISPRPS